MSLLSRTNKQKKKNMERGYKKKKQFFFNEIKRKVSVCVCVRDERRACFQRLESTERASGLSFGLNKRAKEITHGGGGEATKHNATRTRERERERE